MKTTSKGNWFPCWVFIVFENNLIYLMIDQFIQISCRKEDKQYINSTNEIINLGIGKESKMKQSKISKEYKDLLKEAINNQYNYLTQEDVDSLKADAYDAGLLHEVDMNWFPTNFASKINTIIIDVLGQAIWDLHRAIQRDTMDKDNAIVLNPCIENSFNYHILVSQVGEQNAKKYVNAAINDMKEEFGDHYEAFNQKYFKGLMKEL